MSLLSEIPSVVPGEINMRSFSEKLGCAGALIALVVAPLGSLHAGGVPAAYPERPVRYVLPSAPGGGPDVAARIVMAELGRRLGKQIVVDNRPGASGTIGTEAIAKASPDGYTIGHGNINTMAINRSVLPKLTYDLEKYLQPVVHMYGAANLLAVTL